MLYSLLSILFWKYQMCIYHINSVGCDLQDMGTGEMATESLMEDTTTGESTLVTEMGMCFVFC